MAQLKLPVMIIKGVTLEKLLNSLQTVLDPSIFIMSTALITGVDINNALATKPVIPNLLILNSYT